MIIIKFRSLLKSITNYIKTSFWYDLALFFKSCLAGVVVIEVTSAIYYNVNLLELVNSLEYIITNVNQQLLIIIVMLLFTFCLQAGIILYCSILNIKLYIEIKQFNFLVFFSENESLVLSMLGIPIRLVCFWAGLEDNPVLYARICDIFDGYVFADPSSESNTGKTTGGSPNFEIPGLPPRHPFQFTEGWCSRAPNEIHNDNGGREGVSIKHLDYRLCPCYDQVKNLEQLRGGWHECFLSKWIIFMEYDYDRRISLLREIRVNETNPEEISENIAAALRHIQRYDGITLIYYNNVNNPNIWAELARAQSTEVANDINARGGNVSADANFQRFYDKKYMHANSKILRILEKHRPL